MDGKRAFGERGFAERGFAVDGSMRSFAIRRRLKTSSTSQKRFINEMELRSESARDGELHPVCRHRYCRQHSFAGCAQKQNRCPERSKGDTHLGCANGPLPFWRRAISESAGCRPAFV